MRLVTVVCIDRNKTTSDMNAVCTFPAWDFPRMHNLPKTSAIVQALLADLKNIPVFILETT